MLDIEHTLGIEGTDIAFTGCFQLEILERMKNSGEEHLQLGVMIWEKT